MVRFAPLVLPLRRRLQTLGVLFWAFPFIASVFVIAAFILLPWLWPFTFSYILFMLNDRAPTHGGRVSKFMRSLRVWRYFVNYFPMELKKEVDLSPEKTYIFGYHPHGIVGVGVWGNFATEGNNISKVFPGIQFRMGTLDTNFQIPVFRDYIMSLGFISVSKRSIRNFLQSGPGRAMVIVIGGAAESLDARPGTYDLTLRERKGFVKLALTTGSSLVPVFSFGENDVFVQLVPNPEGTTIRKWQNAMKKALGFTLPIVMGRGVFNYDFGFLPLRKRIVSVVGEPIDCPRIESPTAEQIDEYHRRYMEALEALYDKYKDVYAKDRRHEMRFVH